MMTDFDIAVIGAGHAGCEAALAAARMGCRTLVFTVDLPATGPRLRDGLRLRLGARQCAPENAG